MPNQDCPWAERYRAYLHNLAGGKIGQIMADRVDVSGIVQDTLAECCAIKPPDDPDEQKRLIRATFLNNLIDRIRYLKAAKRDVRREVSQDSESQSQLNPFDTLASLTTPSQRAVRNETEARLVKAMAELPDDQRTAIVLHHLLELQVSAVASEMAKSDASVAGLLRRGLRQLREKLTEPPFAH